MPCLGFLKVFGRPVRGSSCEVVREFSKISLPVTTPAVDESATARIVASPKAALDEEFVDPITLAVMNDPVILPSGHIIDRSTGRISWFEVLWLNPHFSSDAL